MLMFSYWWLYLLVLMTSLSTLMGCLLTAIGAYTEMGARYKSCLYPFIAYICYSMYNFQVVNVNNITYVYQFNVSEKV